MLYKDAGIPALPVGKRHLRNTDYNGAIPNVGNLMEILKMVYDAHGDITFKADDAVGWIDHYTGYKATARSVGRRLTQMGLFSGTKIGNRAIYQLKKILEVDCTDIKLHLLD